jgi:hypothetical protein
MPLQSNRPHSQVKRLHTVPMPFLDKRRDWTHKPSWAHCLRPGFYWNPPIRRLEDGSYLFEMEPTSLHIWVENTCGICPLSIGTKKKQCKLLGYEKICFFLDNLQLPQGPGNPESNWKTSDHIWLQGKSPICIIQQLVETPPQVRKYNTRHSWQPIPQTGSH